MLVKVNTNLKDYTNKPLKNEGQNVTLRNIILACLNYVDKEKKQNVEEKVKLYEKSLEVVNNDEVDFSVEELAKIKENVCVLFSTLVVGQVVKIIEGGK